MPVEFVYLETIQAEEIYLNPDRILYIKSDLSSNAPQSIIVMIDGTEFTITGTVTDVVVEIDQQIEVVDKLEDSDNE